MGYPAYLTPEERRANKSAYMREYMKRDYRLPVNAAQQRKWRAENTEKLREHQRRAALKKRFGITIEQYDEMLAAQNGCCAICGTDTCCSGYRLAVDHCHETGKIRGLLCRMCNQTLGRFKDDPERFDRAAEYLRAHVTSCSDMDDTSPAIQEPR